MEKRHTSAEYERELQEIKDGLLYLGALTETALERGSVALLERNAELARKIVCDDDVIDRLDVELEEKCIRLLALQAARGAGPALHHDGDQDHRPPGADR